MGSNEMKHLGVLPHPLVGAVATFPLALSPRGPWTASWPPRPLALPGEGPQGPPMCPRGVRGHPGCCREPPGSSPRLPLGLSLSLFLCMVFALKDLPSLCLGPACCLQMFADVVCRHSRVSGPKPALGA